MPITIPLYEKGVNRHSLLKKLKKLTDLGGMKLHDHIIIGDEKYYSFSEERLLDKL